MGSYIFLLTILSVTGLGISCPSKCVCIEETMQCIGQGLTSVPRGIPRSIERIELQSNNITHISRDDFAELEHLRILYLYQNQIGSIERSSFSENTRLEILRLNENKLTILPENLFVGLKVLQRLDLSFNKISIIERKTLRGPSNLRTLQLSHNEITCVHENSLRAVRHVEFLTLDHNRLTTLAPESFENLDKLRTFRFNNNPLNCNCHLRWIADWLRDRPSAGLFTQCEEPTHLHGMEIKHIQASEFVCNGIVGSQRPTCALNSYCPSACHCSEGIVDCRDSGLTSLPASLPSDVTELRLEQNQIRVIPSRAFARYKKLRRIDISNNLISEISPGAFQGAKHLNSLILYENNIANLPRSVFAGLSNLQLLLLNANKISCLRHDAFDGLSSLKLLSLYDNKLQTIAKGTFRALRSIQTLHLAQNPFICDCNMRWLADYLQENPVETSGAKCVAPRKLTNKKIAHTKARRFRCDNGNNFPSLYAGECSPEAECPPKCRCEGTVVDCSSQQLTSIPDNIPPYATELNLAFNDIEILARLDIFKKLVNLKKINLSNNKLSSIEDGAFNGAGSVLELWMNDNELANLKGEMFSGLSNLRTLLIRNNHLRCISNETFAGLSTVTHLSLYGNKITSIVEGAFDTLTSMTLLNLLSNPLVCNCHLSWLSVWLRTGTFKSGNPRCHEPSFLHGFPVSDINPQDFHCTSAELSKPPTCKPEVKCPERCTCEGSIVRCINVGLTSIPVDDIPATVTELYLNLNRIKLIPQSIKKFTKLEKLDLSNNMIATLQDNLFSNFSRLSTLLLPYNKLQCLPPKGFSGLRNLRILSLHSNEIATVQLGTFDDLTSLSHVALGSNPWYCDCHLSWFSEWINKDYKEPGTAQCSGPPDVAGMVLLTTPPSLFVCNDLPFRKCKKRRKFRRRGPLSIPIASKCDPCLSAPCLHNGTCRLHPEDYYQCICPAGFKGKHCEMPVNACNLNPCRNGATCIGRNEISYTCNCSPGFTGYDCETNIDECALNQCRPKNAICIDGINSFTCQCPAGWSGDFCQIEIEDPCENNPCLNNGKCFPHLTEEAEITYRCECEFGYRGDNCSESWNPCEDHRCENDGTCVHDRSNRAGYRCNCPYGYRGEYCQFAVGRIAVIQQDDPCYEHDCQNDAQCRVDQRGSSDFTCECLPGFTGEKCQMLMGVTFLHNGSYAELDRVIESAEEITISLEISTIQPNGVILYAGESGPDHSRHVVIELFSGHVRFNYDGIMAAIYTEEIISDGEFHQIQITLGLNGVTMTIDDSHNYKAASTKVVNIVSPIYVGGVPASVWPSARRTWQVRNTTTFIGCVRNLVIAGEQIDFFTATQGSYASLFQEETGVKQGCQQVLEPWVCNEVTCKFGECVSNHSSAAYCNCQDGYSGRNCDIEDSQPTACAGNLCEHGICVVTGDDARSYVCECDAGYSGQYCNVRDFCSGVSCGQHGTCKGTQTGYVCECSHGYQGENCDRRIRKCRGTKTRQYVQINVPRPTSSTPTAEEESSSTMLCKSSRKITNLVCDGSPCSRSRRSSSSSRRRRNRDSDRIQSVQNQSSRSCCVPLRKKVKKVNLQCEDGTTIVQQVTKVQSCGCQDC